MRQALLLTAFFALTHLCIGRTAIINSGNNFQHPVPNGSTLITFSQMEQMLSEIMNSVGLPNDFELREAHVLNLEATISHRKRCISYNPEFINQVNAVTKDKWAVMTLLAHEVAHHLEGHTTKKSGSKPELELQADEFAGFVLHKLGASLQQSQEVMKYIAAVKTSKTHPARASRMLAIETGWNKVSNDAEIAVKSNLSSNQEKSN